MGLRVQSAASSGGANLPTHGGGAPGRETGHGGRGGGQPAGGGGAPGQLSPEVQRILQEQAQALNLSRSEIAELRTALAKQDETVGRMRSVFSPVKAESNARKQRAQQYSQDLDQTLEWGVDRARQGADAPMTVKIGADFYQYAAEQSEREDQLMARIAKLEAQLAAAADPRTQINNLAFSQMDNFLTTALDGIYGPGQTYMKQKTYQFKALSAQICDEIKLLQKEKPEVWESIARDREKQKRMVNYFVEQNMPPAARQMVERQRIREEPQGLPQLVEALREARETYADNPTALRQIVPRIRHEIAAEIMQRQKAGQKTDARMGELFR